MNVTLCVLLWAREGRDADLTRYEDHVLGLVGDHDGQVLQRAQTVDGPSGQPTERATMGKPGELRMKPKPGGLVGGP
jgi:hypothetical protein